MIGLEVVTDQIDRIVKKSVSDCSERGQVRAISTNADEERIGVMKVSLLDQGTGLRSFQLVTEEKSTGIEDIMVDPLFTLDFLNELDLKVDQKPIVRVPLVILSLDYGTLLSSQTVVEGRSQDDAPVGVGGVVVSDKHVHIISTDPIGEVQVFEKLFEEVIGDDHITLDGGRMVSVVLGEEGISAVRIVGSDGVEVLDSVATGGSVS